MWVGMPARRKPGNAGTQYRHPRPSTMPDSLNLLKSDEQSFRLMPVEVLQRRFETLESAVVRQLLSWRVVLAGVSGELGGRPTSPHPSRPAAGTTVGMPSRLLDLVFAAYSVAVRGLLAVVDCCRWVGRRLAR